MAPEQRKALEEIKQRLLEKPEVKAIVLYGSYARGLGDDESDVDLLVVTNRPLTRCERHEITDAVFEVNLRHDTNFSTLVVDQESWEGGIISVLPIRDEIIRDGIQI
ncbi:MAG: nucleotidyltransferase domain-containing protein [Sedimentisphaerales bacterium]|nr:nucleotidyltransferase domain-containing protein [Sedimentisphaerales bacterium]